MKVSKVTLYLSSRNSTIAYGKVELNDCLVVDFQLIKSEKGPFTKLGESRQAKNGEWYSSVYVTNAEVREAINKAVINEYNNVLQKSQISEPVSA